MFHKPSETNHIPIGDAIWSHEVLSVAHIGSKVSYSATWSCNVSFCVDTSLIISMRYVNISIHSCFKAFNLILFSWLTKFTWCTGGKRKRMHDSKIRALFFSLRATKTKATGKWLPAVCSPSWTSWQQVVVNALYFTVDNNLRNTISSRLNYACV
jgi:hypothetical protein